MQNHAAIMRFESSRLQELHDENPIYERQIEATNKAIETIDACRETLDSELERRPFKVLGMEASAEVTNYLIGTSLSYFSTLIALYYSSVSNL